MDGDVKFDYKWDGDVGIVEKCDGPLSLSKSVTDLLKKRDGAEQSL